jgi:acyl-CoA synthetase (NDP forming)
MKLDSVFNARSIAVVGAGSKPGSFGGQVLRNLIDFEFQGSLIPVHPRVSEVFGIPAAASLRDLSKPPDLACLAVANHHLLGLLRTCIEIGVRSAFIFGDPTVGTGRDPRLQAQIAEIADNSDLVVVGPNAMGSFSIERRVVISGYPIRPDTPLGQVALLVHSGTVFDSVFQNNRDVNFNYALASGNEADVTLADAMDFVLEDSQTRVVGLYLETVRDPENFTAMLAKAQRRHIPVVALKTGLSKAGQLFTLAHSGALAGTADTYEALFRRYGVRQVHTLDEMMDALELFSRIQHVDGPNLSVLMESGGERSLMVDIGSTQGSSFAEWSPGTRHELSEVLSEGVDPINPLDAFGTGHDVEQTYRRSLEIMDADPATHLNVIGIDFPRDSFLSPEYQRAIKAAQAGLRNPVVGLIHLTSGANVEIVADLRKHGVPMLMGTDSGLGAIQHLIEFSSARGQSWGGPTFAGRPEPDTVAAIRSQLASTRVPLDEHESKKILAAYGLPVSAERSANTLEQAIEAAGAIGYPVALKTLNPELLHKSDHRGLHLGLADSEALAAAYADLDGRLGPRVLVQQMAPSGTELILGMKQDPQFGPQLIFGMGGVLVEVLKDTTTLLAPISHSEALAAPDTLRTAAILDGVRGQAAVDKTRLSELLIRFSRLIHDLGDLLEAIDINPVIFSGEDAWIVDALIIPGSRSTAV